MRLHVKSSMPSKLHKPTKPSSKKHPDPQRERVQTDVEIVPSVPIYSADRLFALLHGRPPSPHLSTDPVVGSVESVRNTRTESGMGERRESKDVDVSRRVMQPPGGITQFSLFGGVNREDQVREQREALQAQMKQDLKKQIELKQEDIISRKKKRDELEKKESERLIEEKAASVGMAQLSIANNIGAVSSSLNCDNNSFDSNYRRPSAIMEQRQRMLQSNPFTSDPKVLEQEKKERRLKELAILHEQIEERKKLKIEQERQQMIQDVEQERRCLSEVKTQPETRKSSILTPIPAVVTRESVVSLNANTPSISPFPVASRSSGANFEQRQRILQSNPFTADPKLLELEKKDKRIRELADLREQIEERKKLKQVQALQLQQELEEEERRFNSKCAPLGDPLKKTPILENVAASLPTVESLAPHALVATEVLNGRPQHVVPVDSSDDRVKNLSDQVAILLEKQDVMLRELLRLKEQKFIFEQASSNELQSKRHAVILKNVFCFFLIYIISEDEFFFSEIGS